LPDRRQALGGTTFEQMGLLAPGDLERPNDVGFSLVISGTTVVAWRRRLPHKR